MPLPFCTCCVNCSPRCDCCASIGTLAQAPQPAPAANTA
jgi:hypothetical protein